MKFTRTFVLGLSVILMMTAAAPFASAQAHDVRWDIINIVFGIPPALNTISAGGVAFASASNPATLMIKLTGSGTFVAPASGGTSGAVTGGGTWETFSSGASTGHGTYIVTSLSSWQFANLQTPGALIDLIATSNEKGANGNAILRIQYSDGSEGILGVGCHGPGAPDGIQEGVIATKNFVTYWTAGVPAPGVNTNRTSFHVRQ